MSIQLTRFFRVMVIGQENKSVGDIIERDLGFKIRLVAEDQIEEAIREGLVATIMRAPCEEAWYYGGLTIRPQRTATEAEAQRHGLVQR